MCAFLKRICCRGVNELNLRNAHPLPGGPGGEGMLFLLLVLGLAIHGCRSFDENRAQQLPAPHHPAIVSPSVPAATARLMDGMGKVDFPITTNSDAQAFFNQGVAQLYGFWFVEAERSFLEATRLDPNAAMAYWGIAMAAPGSFLPSYQIALTPNPGLPA